MKSRIVSRYLTNHFMPALINIRAKQSLLSHSAGSGAKKVAKNFFFPLSLLMFRVYDESLKNSHDKNVFFQNRPKVHCGSKKKLKTKAHKAG